MLAQYLDLTQAYLESTDGVVIEVSNYDYCLIQAINNAGDTIEFRATIDSGAVQGVTDGSALTATNFYIVSATNISDGTLSDHTAGNYIYRLDVVGRFIKLYCGGGDLNVEKLLVMLTKIS